MPDSSLRLSLTELEQLEMELALSVNSNVADHWDQKILSGIVPTEVKNQGEVNSAKHAMEMTRLAEFEADVVTKLLDKEWKTPAFGPAEVIHYFGIGTGEALEKVSAVANQQNNDVMAYDISFVGYDNGRKLFEKQRNASNKSNNMAFLADIEFVCNKFIHSGRSNKLIAGRVLDVLDNQEVGWKRKTKNWRKTARTSRKIGKLLEFLDVLLIHPRPEDNPHAVWGDSTPHTLEEITEYMEEGLMQRVFGGKVQFTLLGNHQFYNHIYTATLIRCGL